MAVLSLLFSACVLVEPETELQTTEVQTGSDNIASLPHPDPTALPQVPPTIEPVPAKETAKTSPSPPQIAAPGAKEIRFLQERLRASGFNPGTADGIWGPKTRRAWLRLHSGCAMLEDLLELAEMVHNANAPSHKLIADRFSREEEVRIVQVRLKDAGFDPGHIDGIVGPKTTSALIRFHSGCALVRNFAISSSGGLVYTQRGVKDLPNLTLE